MSRKVVAYDTFTESSDTDLTSHAAEIGGANWVVGGGTWTVKGGLGYVSMSGANETVTLTSQKLYNGDTFGIGTTPSTVGFGPTIRNIISGSTWNRHLYLAYAAPSTTAGSHRGIELYRRTAGAFTQLTVVTKALAGECQVRVVASGSSSTSLSARYWLSSATEPNTWDTTYSDNTASNQTTEPAPIGFYSEPGHYTLEIIGSTTYPDPAVRSQAVNRSASF